MSPKIPLPTDAELTPGNRKLLAGLPPANVFRMVANAPASLQGFVQLALSLLIQSEFNPRLREIAILRIATLTQSIYEWEQHVYIAKQTGVTEAEIAQLKSEGTVIGLDEEALLICRVAEEITRDVRLSDEALQTIMARYGKRQATELILCCSYFNMLSRFLESTRVEMDADLESLHTN